MTGLGCDDLIETLAISVSQTYYITAFSEADGIAAVVIVFNALG